MSISKASRIVESKRHYVIAIDGIEEGRIFGIIYHIGSSRAMHFGGLMDLVWIIERISDELCGPAALMKQRDFKKMVPMERPDLKKHSSSRVRRGKLATVKLKLNFRNNVSWQGVSAWVEKEKTIGFGSLLELVRFIGEIVEMDDVRETESVDAAVCTIQVDNYEANCLKGRLTMISEAQTSRFHSVLELAKSLDALIVESKKGGPIHYLLEKRLTGTFYEKGKTANFVVHIRFGEHATWQGTIFWCEVKQTVNFRSFLELIKLMDLAVFNVGRWTEVEKARAASE